MYLLVDNYDSFVYNLAAYIRELCSGVEVARNDCIDMELLEKRIENGEMDGIIISPGPKRPEDHRLSLWRNRPEGETPHARKDYGNPSQSFVAVFLLAGKFQCYPLSFSGCKSRKPAGLP